MRPKPPAPEPPRQPILEDVNALLAERFAAGPLPSPIVLDLGSGSTSHFVLPPGARLVAFDISRGQLKRNTATRARVQADLHRLPAREDSAGYAICFNVIEHLADPARAMSQIVRALRPGGLLVLGCPDRTSLKGIITRVAPMWFRRFYFKRIVGRRDRGDGHLDVFRIYFRPLVSSPELPGWLERNGMDVLFYRAYDGAAQFCVTTGGWKPELFARPYYAVAWLGRVLSFGRWRASESDLMIVARRRPIPPA